MSGLCLTFDVEEWSTPADYLDNCRFTNNTKFSRDGTIRILKLLKKHKIKSTFFVTGYFAERHKDILKKISKGGHEIASHSYRDEDHASFSKNTLKHKIRKSKDILEDITKENIAGFRLPLFSINSYLFDVLRSLKFKYDSSFHPAIVPGHYYNIFQKRSKFLKNGITELPVSVIPLLRLPVSWIWMRNLGNTLPNLAALFNKNLIIYFHAWEFAELPSPAGLPFYITRNTGRKFISQLDNFICKWKNLDFNRLDGAS